MDKKNEPDIVLDHTGWSHLAVPSPEEVNYAITGDESQVVTIRLENAEECKG